MLKMYTRTSGALKHLTRIVDSRVLRFTSTNTKSVFLLPHGLRMNPTLHPSPVSASLFSGRQFSSSMDNLQGPSSGTSTGDPNQNATLQWDMSDTDLRDRVLESAIQFVPTYGWSRQALEAACQAEGLPSGLHSLAMPQGSIDLVLHFYASRNERLAEAMSEWRLTESATSASAQTRPSPQEVDEFLYRALKFRLEQIIPVLSEWPQALGLLALPSNVSSSVGLLAQLVDEVWAQAGDRSTDMTWYAKRLGLAYVYNLTEVFMLQDKSPDFVDSWVFLRTRLSDLRSLKQMNLKAVSSMVRDGVMAFGNVTCNILGLARRR